MRSLRSSFFAVAVLVPLWGWAQIDHVTASVDQAPPSVSTVVPDSGDAGSRSNADAEVRITPRAQGQPQWLGRRVPAAQPVVWPRQVTRTVPQPFSAVAPRPVAAPRPVPATAPARTATAADGLVLLLVLAVAGLGIVTVAGLAMAVRGQLVVYASWLDVLLAGLCLASLVGGAYLAAAGATVAAWIPPLVLCGGLLWRGWHLNRSLPKALLALPAQIIGTAIAVILLAAAFGALGNAVDTTSPKRPKNALERSTYLAVFALFSALGTAALTLFQTIIKRGQLAAGQFRIPHPGGP